MSVSSSFVLASACFKTDGGSDFLDSLTKLVADDFINKEVDKEK